MRACAARPKARPCRGVGMHRLPPVDERSHRLIVAVMKRAGQRADDLVQEAWVAYLAGDDPVRRVWRKDRAERRRMTKERLRGDMDMSQHRIREHW